jgi:hypothetical protein
MGINTAAFSNLRNRLGPTYRGFGGPHAAELPNLHSRTNIRSADLRFCADNKGEPGFNSIIHFQRIADARAGKPVPAAILRLLEAGRITQESDYIALDEARHCLPPLRETWALPERTVAIEQNTALIKLTKGLAEQLRHPTLSGQWGLLTKAANLSLGPDTFLVTSMVDIQMRLLDLNDALAPFGVKLSLPTEPTVEIALDRLNPVPAGLNLACFSSSEWYGEPASRGPITTSYISRHEVNEAGRTRSLYRRDEPANFLLQVEIKTKEIA